MANEGGAPSPSPQRIRPRHVAVAVALALAAIAVAVAYVLTLGSFSHETRGHRTPFVAGNPALANGVALDGRTVTVDPETETATVLLSFRPRGSLVDADGFLRQPLILVVETSTGPVTKTFKQGDIMRPETVTVSLLDGFVADYPFDTYHADLDVLITRGDTDRVVPTALDVFAATHGFAFSLQKEGSNSDGGHYVDMTIRRSTATLFFSIFLIVTMWALTLGVLAMLLRVLLLDRPIQFPMFTFLAALLFAFPAIRNAQPNAPVIGVRSDYLSFFWCEALVAITLITLLGVWVARRRYDTA